MRNRCIPRADSGTVSDRFSAFRRSSDCTSRGLQIMTAALPGLPPAKQPGEISVKLLKVLMYLLESLRIHFPASPDQDFPYNALILSGQLSL